MTSNGARRGRPPRVDPSDLGRKALMSIAANGYRQTSMERVATEVGVSVRTLHRYFPTKADIVWGPIDTSFRDLHERLDAAPSGLGVMDAVLWALVAGFGRSPDDLATARLRFRLISETLELHGRASEPFVRWRNEIADYIAARRGVGPDDLVAVAVAAGIQSAAMTALSWWSMHSVDGSPEGALARALHALGNDAASSAET